MEFQALIYSTYKDIHPNELDLRKTVISDLKAAYVDKDISVKKSRNKFKYTLYGKRNDFLFQVISMPNLKSNIPIVRPVFYGYM